MDNTEQMNMPFSEERICYLLKAYTYHTATAAEEEELFKWVANTPDDTLLQNHIEQLVRTHTDEEFPKVDWDDLYQQVLQRTGKNFQISSVRSMHWRRVAAAILILIIAGGSIYFFSHKKQQPTTAIGEARYYKNDIRPGGTKAILRAGNTQVILNKKDTNFILAGNAVHINDGKVKIADAAATQYTLITPRGGTYSLALADGTIVWLNAGSKLVYPSVFTGDTREVTLEGEAYFKVHHDARHPFIVHTAQQSIRVLGTEFNVHAYSDEINMITTLVKGNVQVKSSGKTLQLQPGQQAQLNKEGQLNLVPDADVEQAIAWKNGYFRFDKADIHTIMQQLSRWYDIEVSYKGNIPKNYFGAIISRDNNISQVLNMLEATGEVYFEIEGRKVVVKR